MYLPSIILWWAGRIRWRRIRSYCRRGVLIALWMVLSISWPLSSSWILRWWRLRVLCLTIRLSSKENRNLKQVSYDG